MSIALPSIDFSRVRYKDIIALQHFCSTEALYDQLRKQLVAATNNWNKEKLTRVIDSFLNAEVPDGEELLAKADRRLVHIEVRKGKPDSELFSTLF